MGNVEIGRGPSELEVILNSFKNEGRIEISPRAARSLLLERLLAHFRSTQGVNVNVEVLAQIAGEGEEPVNFTEAHRKFVKELQHREGGHLQDLGPEGTVYVPATKQREI